MNISSCISQVCNPVGLQRLRTCFTFSSLSLSVRIKQGMEICFPLFYVSWRRPGLRKATDQQSWRGLIPYFTLLYPPRVRLLSGITKARLWQPRWKLALPEYKLSKYSTGHQVTSEEISFLQKYLCQVLVSQQDSSLFLILAGGRLKMLAID